jgi:hypothetical protein
MLSQKKVSGSMVALAYTREGGDCRVRGPAISEFIKAKPGAPFDEGIIRADDSHHVICSNMRITRAFMEKDDIAVKEVFPCATGTMAAYEMPEKRLGKTIEYVDSKTKLRWIFHVPEEFRGEKNCVLLAEHPAYSVERDRRNRVVHASAVQIVQAFPASNGTYPADPVHGIPCGEGNDDPGADTRHLWRIGKRVGPVARGFGYKKFGGYGIRRNVHLDKEPSRELGIAVEAMARDKLRPLDTMR